VTDLQAPTPRPRARPTPTALPWGLALMLAAVAADSVQAGADAPVEPFDTATGQIAAQATDTMVGFVDRAMDVVWTGGDTLRLPTGDGAITRLARQLPLQRLVNAGEAAFDGAGYDRLVVTGVEIADRALRLAGRPTGVRLQGSSRPIRGNASSGAGYSGQGLALAASGARQVSDQVVLGFGVGIDSGTVRMGAGGGELVSEGWTTAAQLGWRATPDTTFSVAAGVGLASGDIARGQGAVTADAEARRDFIALRAEHAFAVNGFRLTPSSTLQFTTEAQDAYTDSAGVQFGDELMSYGRLSASVEVGYDFDLGRGSIDVYANVGGDWDFVHPDQVTLTTGRWDHGLAAGARAASGVTLSSSSGFTSNLELGNSLIGMGGLNDTRLRGSVGFGF
jgi:hypothetical protein